MADFIGELQKINLYEGEIGDIHMFGMGNVGTCKMFDLYINEDSAFVNSV